MYQITGLGYNIQFAQEALRTSDNDVLKALDLLDRYDGILPPDVTSPVTSPISGKFNLSPLFYPLYIYIYIYIHAHTQSV